MTPRPVLQALRRRLSRELRPGFPAAGPLPARLQEDDAIEHPFGSDPMDRWIGVVVGGADDESIRHDAYLYDWPDD